MKKAFKPLFDLAKKVQKNLGSDSEADQEFIEKIKEQIEDFKKSRQRTLHLEPMNSYERRLVHNLAPEFGLSSYSEGEEDERHLVLSKDKKAAEEEQTEERPKRRAKVEPEAEKESRSARSPRREHSTNSRARKTEEPAETDNEEFLAELKQEVAKFQKSKEKVHHLAPMNSYQRMLVHTLAKELELFSASEGDEERHIVLYKEEPPKSAERRPPAEKRDREEPRERKPFARREGRADEGRDRGERGGRPRFSLAQAERRPQRSGRR